MLKDHGTWLVLPAYRNQSIDLLSKLIDWFLNEGNAVSIVTSSRKIVWKNGPNGTFSALMLRTRLH